MIDEADDIKVSSWQGTSIYQLGHGFLWRQSYTITRALPTINLNVGRARAGVGFGDVLSCDSTLIGARFNAPLDTKTYECVSVCKHRVWKYLGFPVPIMLLVVASFYVVLFEVYTVQVALFRHLDVFSIHRPFLRSLVDMYCLIFTIKQLLLFSKKPILEIN